MAIAFRVTGGVLREVVPASEIVWVVLVGIRFEDARFAVFLLFAVFEGEIRRR